MGERWTRAGSGFSSRPSAANGFKSCERRMRDGDGKADGRRGDGDVKETKTRRGEVVEKGEDGGDRKKRGKGK